MRKRTNAVNRNEKGMALNDGRDRHHPPVVANTLPNGSTISGEDFGRQPDFTKQPLLCSTGTPRQFPRFP
jgi:hypothetical protein